MTVDPSAMGLIDEHGRPEPPPSANEVDTLIGFLEWQRSTLEWKIRGLDRVGMNTTVAESSMTLGGIVKHLAWVEDHWFSYFLHDRARSATWELVDWSAEPNWEWTSAASDLPEALRALWTRACEASRTALDEALTRGGLDQLSRRTWDNGDAPSLRWILVHMIEEYARHNGHADLIREAIDGQVGE